MLRLFEFAPVNDEALWPRVEQLMNPGNGFVVLPLTNLREAWFSHFANRLLVVPYEHLTLDPERTLKALYEALGEPCFGHDFNALEFDAPERDVPGIPPDVFNKFAPAQFWKAPNQNPQGVLVL